MRFFRPVAISESISLLNAGSKAIKTGATVKEVLKPTLKPTVRFLLYATAKQLANRLAANQLTAAQTPSPLNTYTASQIGTGTRKRLSKYKEEISRQSDFKIIIVIS